MRSRTETLYGVRVRIAMPLQSSGPSCWITNVAPTTFVEADRIADALTRAPFRSPACAYEVHAADENHPLWDFSRSVNEDGGQNR